MRNTILALLAFGSLSIAGASHAAAFDYPYCLQSHPEGRICEYSSYQQCMATAWGIGADCIVNPYVAFAQPAQQYPQSRRARRGYY